MNDNPLINVCISVITPCYNSGAYIADAIESVIAQSFVNWEMIIVDDCSSDNSAFIINQYSSKDARIKYFKTDFPSGSPTLPRNIGIKYAKGKYIAFLDSDDIWLPEKLKEQIKFINKPDIAIVFSNYEKINEAGKRAAREIIAPPLVDYYQLLKGNFIGCLTVLYDTDKVGKMYFKNVRHEDCVLWLSILKKGYKAQNTNTVTALYRVGSHSISSNKVKLLLWQWNILRKEEELSFYKAFYYYIHYAIRAFLKSLK